MGDGMKEHGYGGSGKTTYLTVCRTAMSRSDRRMTKGQHGDGPALYLDGGSSCADSLPAKILYMHVSARADVIDEIPAGMVGIFVNHDVVGVPEPGVAKGEVGCRHLPEPAVESETVGASTRHTPHMA